MAPQGLGHQWRLLVKHTSAITPFQRDGEAKEIMIDRLSMMAKRASMGLHSFDPYGGYRTAFAPSYDNIGKARGVSLIIHQQDVP